MLGYTAWEKSKHFNVKLMLIVLSSWLTIRRRCIQQGTIEVTFVHNKSILLSPDYYIIYIKWSICKHFVDTTCPSPPTSQLVTLVVTNTAPRHPSVTDPSIQTRTGIVFRPPNMTNTYDHSEQVANDGSGDARRRRTHISSLDTTTICQENGDDTLIADNRQRLRYRQQRVKMSRGATPYIMWPLLLISSIAVLGGLDIKGSTFVASEEFQTEGNLDGDDGTMPLQNDDIGTVNSENEDGVHDVSGLAIEEPDNTSDDQDLGGTIPPSLVKATIVGAQLRHRGQTEKEEDTSDDDPSDETTNNITTEQEGDESESPNVNTEGHVPRNPKTPLAGCHWGTTGCNKGKWKGSVAGGSAAAVANSSSIESSGNIPEEGDPSTPSTISSFAGSATAKIKAHIKKARGVNPSDGMSSNSGKERAASSTNKQDTVDSKGPPQGFQLTARIVTSPSDGLSYFLDMPEDPDGEIGNWMMNIPYAYVECGQSVESTTEAFSLEDMVVRHFPGGAEMGHWVNLAGGVTVESISLDDQEEGSDGNENESKYINGNHDGHPKLLVALSPIIITVSGNDGEARTFYPGDVVLMEDTLGKGHKMRAAPEEDKKLGVRGKDLSVLMVSLPHTVHYPMHDWSGGHPHLDGAVKASDAAESTTATAAASPPSAYSGAQHSVFGFTPKGKNHNHKDYRSSFATSTAKPCPLEYDSVYSSLFTPSYNQRRRSGRRQRRVYKKREDAFEDSYPPPGLSMYDMDDIQFLPSLRRTMLFGLGISLTSSFVYCVQLLYPPLLALLGGATFILGGAVINVLGARWSYRQWMTIWEEEWRWKREMKKHKQQREEQLERSKTETKNEKDSDNATTNGSENDLLDTTS